jgi:hypothetical protein
VVVYPAVYGKAREKEREREREIRIYFLAQNALVVEEEIG